MIDEVRLEILFSLVLRDFESAALVGDDGSVLQLKYESLADIGTLPAAATTVAKYFPQERGSLYILNDPYSGGSLLSHISLVTTLETPHQKMTLVARTGFRPSIQLGKKLDEEGLRIPPTPLGQKFQVNEAILAAIESHPMAPFGFADRVKKLAVKLWDTANSFETWSKNHPGAISKAACKNALKLTQKHFLNKLTEFPSGDVKQEVHLETGEVIKLRLSAQENFLNFDFSGSSASERICLTQEATLGACAGAAIAFLRQDYPINSGFLSCLQVAAPLGSCLNAKYPSPTYRGITEGTQVVASLITSALSELMPAFACNFSTVPPSYITLEFADGKKFYDAVPSGASSGPKGQGIDAVQFWLRNHTQNSVQEIENRFPILIKQIALRMSSGGKGEIRGGNGITKEYEVLNDCKLRWLMESRRPHQKGGKGLLWGETPQILVQFSNRPVGEDEKLINEPEGEVDLPAGTRIFVSSAGGLGFNGSTSVRT